MQLAQIFSVKQVYSASGSQDCDDHSVQRQSFRVGGGLGIDLDGLAAGEEIEEKFVDFPCVSPQIVGIRDIVLRKDLTIYRKRIGRIRFRLMQSAVHIDAAEQKEK